MPNVLAFDPGGDQGVGASGWCYLNENKVHALSDTQDLNGFLRKWDLKKLPVDHVVVEGYFALAKKAGAHRNKRLPAVENIGVVKMWADMMGIPWTEYDPKLKGVQAAVTQVFPKKGRKDVSHKLDAYNHGYWYLHSVHGAPSKLEQQMKA